MPKLTLHADSRTISQAKKLAAENHTSVSAMFVRLVRSMTQHKKSDASLGPITRQVSGIVKLPPSETSRDVLTNALMEEYGLKK